MLLKRNLCPQIPGIDIFCTDRIGGYSTGNYTSFNLGRKSGDDIEIVQKNRQLLAGVLWKNPSNFVYMNQVHGGDVCVLKKGELYDGEGCDALLTDDTSKIPIVLVADCVPIVVYDSTKKIMGVIHSGWRGTVKNILGNTIIKMKETFGSRLQDIYIVIGPCISERNYEVDETIASHFSDMFYTKNEKGGYQLDLRKIIIDQADIGGILKEKIYHIEMCSFQNEDLFFSARRDGFESGRFALGICKK